MASFWNLKPKFCSGTEKQLYLTLELNRKLLLGRWSTFEAWHNNVSTAKEVDFWVKVVFAIEMNPIFVGKLIITISQRVYMLEFYKSIELDMYRTRY